MSNVLISIVGSNPIPIYVVAKYSILDEREPEDKNILQKPNIFLFVYSDNTKRYFDRISEQLREDGVTNIEECNLNNDHVYADEIMEAIKTKLSELNEKEQIGTLILNNTGGTKPMATYSTMAVYDFVNKCKRNKQDIREMECYLDSNTKTIRLNSLIEPLKINSTNSYCPRKKDLRYYLRDMDIKTILKLHDLPMNHYKDSDLNTADYESINKYQIDRSEFIRFCQELINNHKVDFENTLRKLYLKSRFINDKETKHIVIEFLKNNMEGTNINDINPSHRKTLPKILRSEEYAWLKEILPSIESILDNTKSAEKLLNFLTGTYIEHYVVAAIEEAIEKSQLQNQIKMYHSLVCYLDESDKTLNFELDIVLLKGYELIVITCTTDDTAHLTKMKSFEGLHRAEQIGGEHSKLIIVNMVEDTSRLHSNLQSFNSEFYKNAKVICKNELKSFATLVAQLKEIITN